ncbi:MAG: carbohydrate-binding family 9-like protein [Kiritimatiellae bacterium]|nr:carbohydrate-binding family 9-like protein [Kiritimatiellia bacterium]
MKRYTVKRGGEGKELEAVDFGPAEEGRLEVVRPESALPVPEVRFRVLHDAANLYVRFDVKDRYVRSVQTARHSAVCTDSCVEFFVQPKAGKGYFNIEINAGGTLLCFYVEDPTRTPAGLAKFTPLSDALCDRIAIKTSLPRTIDPEITEPTDWQVRYRVPFEVFAAFTGPVDCSVPWRGNFYKCADRTSHPHWMAWSPITALNFHLPACFGELVLA